MDAPVYPPATAYVAPIRIARILDARHSSIADLQADPAAWAIVLKEAPGIELAIGNSMMKPHLGNFSLGDLVQFGVVKSDVLGKIDEQLRALGPQL